MSAKIKSSSAPDAKESAVTKIRKEREVRRKIKKGNAKLRHNIEKYAKGKEELK